MKNKLFLFVAVITIMTALVITSFASYYASDESGKSKVPEYIESISVGTEKVKIPETGEAYELTPSGNLNLIDDISTYIDVDENGSVNSYSETNGSKMTKQIFTVQTKSGNTFYIILDRNGSNENAYLLNLVDESDLLKIVMDGEECICGDKCKNGDYNEECPVCRYDYRNCKGSEPLTTEKITEEIIEEDENKNGSSFSPVVLIILILCVGGGFAFYWFKVRPESKQDETAVDEDIDEGPEINKDNE